jgi:uncharacterized damage-inducible protein DinB
MFSDSQLYRLKYQHETIAELVHGLPEAQLRKEVDPGKWSVHQNIAHLASYQEVFLERLRRIQTEHEPQFGRYVADNDPAFLNACGKDVPHLLQELSTRRQSILNTLLSLDEEALRRTAVHAKFGKMDVTSWLEFFLLHESHHLYTIFMLTADLRTSLHLQI